MMMKVVFAAVLISSALALAPTDPECDASVASTVTDAFVGGTLYVYDPATPGAWSGSVDLAQAAINAGHTPEHKPHMVNPNPSETLVAIPYTGDKVVHIMDPSTMELVHSLDAEAPADGVVGGAMHAGVWVDDNSFVIVDMTGSKDGQTGGLLHLFTGMQTGTSTYVTSLPMGPQAAMRGTSGTKPIAMGNNPNGPAAQKFFVSDAKGGGSIVHIDVASSDPMSVLADFSVADMGGCSGGGLWVEAHPALDDHVVVQYGSQDAEDGTLTPECFAVVDMTNMVVIDTMVLTDYANNADDAHGLQFCTDTDGFHYLVNTNRISGTLDIVQLDRSTGTMVTPPVVVDFDLNNAMFPGEAPKLQTDVAWLDTSDPDNVLYIAGRGASPISGTKPYNVLDTAVSGLYSISLGSNCRTPTFDPAKNIALSAETSHIAAGLESDVHSVWGVNGKLWAVDQAGTGSMEMDSLGCDEVYVQG